MNVISANYKQQSGPYFGIVNNEGNTVAVVRANEKSLAHLFAAVLEMKKVLELLVAACDKRDTDVETESLARAAMLARALLKQFEDEN